MSKSKIKTKNIKQVFFFFLMLSIPSINGFETYALEVPF